MSVTGEKGTRNASDRRIRKIVIVGGGTAGWMAAAWLRFSMEQEACRIVLVESEEIGIVGVGESTLPSMRRFNRALGIDENEFVSKTQATFKLAIEFVDWWRLGQSYFNPLDSQGFSPEEESDRLNNQLPAIFQYLLKRAVDSGDVDLDQYSLCTVAARSNRFDRPQNIPAAAFAYAFQFDAALYAKYLRNYSEQRGVDRIEGKIVDVQLHGENGFIDAVVLKSGERVDGDFFIDCTGFRALLIGQALKVPYLDWSQWLPCDRAWAVPCETTAGITPYTRATAREAGWQWRIPLQHRTGNGYVFSSKYLSEEKARDALLSRLEGTPLAEPRLLKFQAGRRKEAWTKNCVALGLSSGFVEPLESTSIQLIQNYLTHLVNQFPDRDCDPLLSDDFNRRVSIGFDSVRDIVIVHYKATDREDTEFWRYCKYMSIPDSLAITMEMFRKYGRFTINLNQGFPPRQWLGVMLNHGIMPQSYCPLVMRLDDKTIRSEMAKIRAGVKRSVEMMPRHEDFIAKNCKAANVAD